MASTSQNDKKIPVTVYKKTPQGKIPVTTFIKQKIPVIVTPIQQNFIKNMKNLV